MDELAFEIAVDRSKCLMRERMLIDQARVVADSASVARGEERARMDAAIGELEGTVAKKDAKIKRLRPWATAAKIATVGVLVGTGILIASEVAP